MTSSGALGSHATAALHVMAFPRDDSNSLSSELGIEDIARLCTLNVEEKLQDAVKMDLFSAAEIIMVVTSG